SCFDLGETAPGMVAALLQAGRLLLQRGHLLLAPPTSIALGRQLLGHARSPVARRRQRLLRGTGGLLRPPRRLLGSPHLPAGGPARGPPAATAHAGSRD